MITAERLRELLNYDPETGIFIWKVDKGRIRKDSIAGSSWKAKYWRIVIDKKIYYAHSLAFLFMVGHINRNGNDNRWCNLREANKYQSAQNKTITTRNSSGYIGVYQCSTTGRWSAQIVSEGKTKFLGRYNTPEEAAKVRDSHAEKIHQEFAVLNT